MNNSLYSFEELLLIRWPVIAFVICTLIASGIYIGVDIMEADSSSELRSAQSTFRQAQSSVELIEEEEATIIEYIDEFQQLSEEGIFEAEDRLQFLEDMAVIRDELNLFPISLSIEQQFRERLEYPADNGTPGGPIDLYSSAVQLSMPLLHEEDFTRFLAAVELSAGLFQLKECSLTLRNSSAKSFTTLQQHMSVGCQMLWYTYNLQPEPVTQQTTFLGGG